VPEPNALTVDDQPGTEFMRSLLSLAPYHPSVAELEHVGTYLAEIREAIEQLPAVSAADPVEHGFDPAWPDDES
jgi:hypothetical protein